MKLHEIGVSYSFEELFENKEGRIRGILNNQAKVNKLEQAIQKDSSAQVESAEQLMAVLADADPSRNGQFLNWIVDRYNEGNFKVEDLSRVVNALTGFEQFKRQLTQKDINSYRRLSDLEDALQPHMDSEESKTPQSRSEIKQQAYKEADVFLKEGDFLVLIPKTEEAACYLGRGTKWCTAYTKAENRFEEHNSKGPLYTIITEIDGKTRKFQLHYETDQFMNEKDNTLSPKEIAALSSKPAYTKFLNMLIDKHYGKYFQ